MKLRVSDAGLKYRIPVSGLPTKLPLLKITHGCCGPVKKRFQKISYAWGAVWAACMCERCESRMAVVDKDAASSTEKTAIVITHPRFKGAASTWEAVRSKTRGVAA